MKRRSRLYELVAAVIIIVVGWAIYWSRIDDQRAREQRAVQEAQQIEPEAPETREAP